MSIREGERYVYTQLMLNLASSRRVTDGATRYPWLFIMCLDKTLEDILIAWYAPLDVRGLQYSSRRSHSEDSWPQPRVLNCGG